MLKVLSYNGHIAHEVWPSDCPDYFPTTNYHCPEVNFYSHGDSGMVLILSPAFLFSKSSSKKCCFKTRVVLKYKVQFYENAITVMHDENL